MLSLAGSNLDKQYIVLPIASNVIKLRTLQDSQNEFLYQPFSN